MTKLLTIENLLGITAIIGVIIFYGSLFYLICKLYKKKRAKKQQKEERHCKERKIISALTNYVERNHIKEDLTNCRILEVPNGKTFFVNESKKQFGIYKKMEIYRVRTNHVLWDLADNRLDILLENLENNILPECLSNCCDLGGMLERYNFKDLIKIDFTDKSYIDKERTYTLEDKSNDAFWGAMIGDMFNRNVFDNYDVTGAIIGASGERKIYEDVKKKTHILLDVVLYFNNLNKPTETFTFYYEKEAREFLGVLEFIMNNK